MNDWQESEVVWYRKYGKYPERIHLDLKNCFYVVGDVSWNINNPDKPELVEELMKKHIKSNEEQP